MKFSIILASFASLILTVIAKSKAAAVPKSKSKGNPLNFGTGIFNRLMREMKVTFCSELEAVTLQMTRPIDSAISLSQIDMMTGCINDEYKDPEIVVSTLAKFSRKLAETNAYTKIKSLLSVHQVLLKLSPGAQKTWIQCIQSIRSEQDHKTGRNFFDVDSIEDVADSAATVAEMEALELARTYARYFLDSVQARADILKIKDSDNKARILVDVLEEGQEVEACCKVADSPVAKQCFDTVKQDRAWALKHAEKLYETGVKSADVETELLAAISKCGGTVDTAGPSKKAASASVTDEYESATVSNPTSGKKSNKNADRGDEKYAEGFDDDADNEHARKGAQTSTSVNVKNSSPAALKRSAAAQAGGGGASAGSAKKSSVSSSSSNIDKRKTGGKTKVATAGKSKGKKQ